MITNYIIVKEMITNDDFVIDTITNDNVFINTITNGNVFLCLLRAHEQDLTKRHEREVGEISVSHSREKQIMLSDFNKAQEVLKDKISALQIL